MNIAVDGGGLCSENRYGNYIFSENLIRALSLYDKKNRYTIYSFCGKPDSLSIPSRWEYKRLLPKRFWLKVRVSFEEFIRPKDIFLALNQALPLYSRSKMISFCHGLSYYFYPRLYSDLYSRLSGQLEVMMKKSKYIVVSSIKVKQELRKLYPKNKNVVVIPYGIPFDMEKDTTLRRPHKSCNHEFFLHVGMDHPIKNIEFIKDAFEEFRKQRQYKDYRLVCIAAGASRSELGKLYREATGYLTASHYESFNLPAVEALYNGCPVIGLSSAIIPEMRKYTYVVGSKEEFVQKMELLADGKSKTINHESLRQTFSWYKSVKKLFKLY